MERKKNRKVSNPISEADKKAKKKTKQKALKNKIDKTDVVKTKIKKSKRYKVTPRFYITIILFFLIIGLAYLLIDAFTNNKFDIKSIKIIGNTTYPQTEIDQKIVNIYNENIFCINKNKIKKSLNEYSYIYDVNLDRKLPNSLIINILERNKYYIAFNKETSEYIRLDKYGIILEKIDLNEKEDNEIVLFGINFEDEIVVSDSIKELELAKLKVYENISTKFIQKGITTKITSAEFTEDKVIITLGYNIRVIIKDDENLDYNTEFLISILKEVENKAGTIDMTKKNPTFSEVR